MYVGLRRIVSLVISRKICRNNTFIDYFIQILTIFLAFVYWTLTNFDSKVVVRKCLDQDIDVFPIFLLLILEIERSQKKAFYFSTYA